MNLEALSFFKSIGRTFRGEIWENAAGVRMGLGYANDDKPFDIETACYLKPIFRAIKSRDTRIIVLKAAVQTLKTFVLEESAAYIIQHDPGDTAFYLADVDAAHDLAKGRIMPRLKSIPSIASAIGAVENRHDITTTEIMLPGMSFRVWPLNESSTQTFTIQNVFISDAWLAKRNGLIRHAKKRATQWERKCKIIIESQGSTEGDDFDIEWNDTDQGELHIICPFCRMAQPFAWESLRPENFEPVLPLDQREQHAEANLRALADRLRGRYAGMQKGDAQLVLFADGTIDESAIMRETHYECYHCGSRINDTPANRLALDQSSHYLPKNPKAVTGVVGFTWPKWINQRLSWGRIMLDYLKAKHMDEKKGNRMPLQEWYQKDAAQQWREDLGGNKIQAIGEAYDIQSKWDKEWRRCLLVDCQQELTHFWYSVHAVAKNAETRQLARGCILSFEELAKIQKEFGVLDQYVFLDAGYKQETLVDECARHRHAARFMIGGKPFQKLVCWTLLKGSGLPWFIHKGDQQKQLRHAISDPLIFKTKVTEPDAMVDVYLYNLSSLQCKDMARRYRDGDNAPRCQFLPETGNPEDELSWTAQYHSEKRIKKPSKTLGGIAQFIWVPKSHMRPNHGWDLLQNLMAVLHLWGLGNVISEPEQPEEQAETANATATN